MSDERPYMHDVVKSTEDWNRMVESKPAGYTVGDLLNDYRQPDWCQHPNAVQGMLGCWSLWHGMVTGRDYCRTCEFSTDHAGEPGLP